MNNKETEKENKTLVFESKSNSISLLYDDNNMAIASLDLLHEDDTLEDCNRNGCNFSHEAILKSLKTFYNKPIIYRLNSEVEEAATDVTSHARNSKQKLQTRIAGHIPTDARYKFIERDNGKTYLNMEAVIQKRYVPTLMNILKERDGRVDLSIEIDVLDGYQDEDTGIYVIKDFILNGVCLLGEDIEPGMEECHLEMITFDKNDDIQKFNKMYIDFSLKQNNIIEKIKYSKNFEKGGKMELEHRKLEELLWRELSSKVYTVDGFTNHKYYIERIYNDHVVVKDNESGEFVKLKYSIDKEGNVHVDYSTAKSLEDNMKNFELYTEFAKEDIGSKEAIKVNKKEIKDTPWGQIDKSELRKRVIEAKNFKTIAKDIFLDLREGWEEGKESALKYPVMEIEGNTAYYNRGALGSAKGYAEKNNEEEVLDKLKAIYKNLDLEFEDKEDCPKAMMSCEEENMKHEEEKEEFADKEVEPEKDVVEEPHAGAQKDKNKKDAKDDEEVRNDDVKKEVEMSTDANVDPSANVEIQDKQAETNKDLADKQNPSVANLDLMKEIEELKGQLVELEELRTFKKNVEEKEKEFRVGSLMNEVKDILPEDVKDEFNNKAKEYSLSNIGEWENMVKAKAFEYSDKKKTNVAPKYVRMSIWGNEKKPETQEKGLWAGIIK